MFRFLRTPRIATTSPGFYISDKAATNVTTWWHNEGRHEAMAIKVSERAAWQLRNDVR